MRNFTRILCSAAVIIAAAVLKAEDKPITQLSANKTAIHAKDSEGVFATELTIEAPEDWQIELPEWVKIEKKLSGGAGKHGFNLYILANSELKPRKDNIKIKSGKKTLLVEVEQDKVLDRLTTNTDKLGICDKGNARELRVSSSYPWTATTKDRWLKLPKMPGKAGVAFMKIGAEPNKSADKERTGTITIQYAGARGKTDGKSITVTVTQGKNGDYWNTGEVLWINKHKKGRGVPVMIVGDGFDREDLKKGGLWETAGRCLADVFRNTMVVKDLYGDYIDLGIFMAESADRGVEAKDYQNCNPKRDTVFGARQWSEYDSGKVRKMLEITLDKEIPGCNKEAIRFCFMANGPFGGWAYLNNNAFMTLTQATEAYWTAHEFVGHAFSGLPDLYFTNPDANCENVDFTDDPKKVKWKAFLEKKEYVQDGVGIHKRGEAGGKSVYNAEPYDRSVMKGPPRAYFTALERYQIWKFILKSAGAKESYLTPENFFEFDIPRYVGTHEKFHFNEMNGKRPPIITEWWKDLWKLEK